MKKDGAERALRYLMGGWRAEPDRQAVPNADLRFADFRSWLHANDHGHYLDFRSVMGAEYEAERWFDEEFRQSWMR